MSGEMSDRRQLIDLDGVLEVTERFCARPTDPGSDWRRLAPSRMGVSLPGVGDLQFAFDDGGVDVRPAPASADGPHLQLSVADWMGLLEGSTTVTDLWVAGRLQLRSSETWRTEYARFFNFIRVAQARPTTRGVRDDDG